jgi:hypothetical protein
MFLLLWAVMLISTDVGNFTEAMDMLKKLDFPNEKILNHSIKEFVKYTGIQL